MTTKATTTAIALAMMLFSLSGKTEQWLPMGSATLACTSSQISPECGHAMRAIAAQAGEALRASAPEQSSRCLDAARGLISMEATRRCHAQATQWRHKEAGRNSGPIGRANLEHDDIAGECAAITVWVGAADEKAFMDECVKRSSNVLAHIRSAPDPRPLFEAECRALEAVSEVAFDEERRARCPRRAARAWIDAATPETIRTWHARYRAWACSQMLSVPKAQLGQTFESQDTEEVMARCMRVLESVQ